MNILKKIQRRINSTIDEMKKYSYKYVLNEGERYDPTIGSSVNWIDLCHIPRYSFALEYITKDDIVLDVACGTGYGSALMARNAQYVFGVDKSKNAINHAKRKNNNKNISFLLSDFFQISKTFDIVVSFETIEHIPTPLQNVLEKLVLYTHKILIGSAPYKEIENNNPFHVHYDLDETSFECLKKYGNLTFFYQTPNGTIYNHMPQEKIQNIIFVLQRKKI